MSRQDDDNLDDVLAQVNAALDALHVGDDSRGPLLDGVRDALRDVMDALPHGADVTVTTTLEDEPTPSARPDLRVVPDDEVDEEVEDEVDEEDTLAGFTEVGPGEWVKVLDVSRSSSADSVELDDGRIHVEAGAWQTVFRGTEPQTYRLSCEQGALEIAVDGELTDQLHPGQTLDLAAALIRVRAVNDSARGGYRRL